MRALTLHVRDLWPILAILVIVVMPAAMFLVLVGRVRRARLAAEKDRTRAPGRIRVLGRPDLLDRSGADLAQVVRSSLAEAFGEAGNLWAVDFGPPAAAVPLVVVEITVPGDVVDAAAGLAETLRTRLAEGAAVAPADIDVRLVPAPV